MPHRLERWAIERPFLLALVVMSLIIIPGFVAVSKAINDAEQAIDRAEAVAVAAQAVADRNAQTVKCVTRWVKKNTDALQDRDVVDGTETATELDTWVGLYRYLDTAPVGSSRDPLLRTIDQQIEVLRRLLRNEEINPYPEIEGCLNKPLPTLFTLATALHPGHHCWGRVPTIRGTYQDDILRGTDKNDVIVGLKGDDLIFAGDGRDYICGDRGNDTINGGGGHDSARGGRGADLCVQTEKNKGC